MNQINPSEPGKKNGWKTVIFIVLGVLLALGLTAVLVVNRLFKDLSESPEDNRTTIQSAENEPAESGGSKEAAKIAEVPIAENGQVDLDAVRDVLIPKETLDSIDAEEESSLRQAVEENLASIPNTEGVYSILLIGNDTRNVSVTERTDCVFLLSINQNTNRVVLTSFPQNLYVYIADWDSTNFLHVANTLGGPTLTAKTIEQNFGVAIDAYASINFDSFTRAVDTFGGVEMSLSAAELAQITGSGTPPAETEPGVYRLSGEQTLAYCRGLTGNDAGHTGRQLSVLRKLWEQSKTVSFSTRYEVFQQTLKDISTTVTRQKCLQLLMDITDLHKYEMVTVTLPAEGLYESRTIDASTVLIADMKANTAYIQELVYGTT